MSTRRLWTRGNLALAILACLLTAVTRASEVPETDDFGVVQSKAIELGKKYGPENVLLVFDIDNTLLAGNQPLGSDQWYDWQDGLMKERPNSALLVASDSKGLLRAQGILFALGSMHPPQRNLPRMVEGLQARGFPTIILTSRGPEFRDATMRHLKESGYKFAEHAPKMRPEFSGVFEPYRLDSVTSSGLRPVEVDRFDLSKPREVSYDQGVFMTSGQNKGVMLLIFLAHCQRRFSAVVFVDDKEKHAESVRSALTHRRIEVHPYRYSNEDEEVAAFSAEEKLEATEGWLRLKATMEEAFK